VEVPQKGRTRLLERELSRSRIERCDTVSLKLIRNAIFARHGYRFSSPDLTAHFGRFDWYRPDDLATKKLKAGELLTTIDKKNIELLKAIEKERQPETNQDSAVSALVGKEFVVNTPAGSTRFHMCAGTAAHVEVGGLVDQWKWTKHGSWSAQGSMVSFHWASEDGIEGYGEVVVCAGGGPCTYKTYRPFHRTIDEHAELDLDEFTSGAPVTLDVDGPASLCR